MSTHVLPDGEYPVRLIQGCVMGRPLVMMAMGRYLGVRELRRMARYCRKSARPHKAEADKLQAQLTKELAESGVPNAFYVVQLRRDIEMAHVNTYRWIAQACERRMRQKNKEAP